MVLRDIQTLIESSICDPVDREQKHLETQKIAGAFMFIGILGLTPRNVQSRKQECDHDRTHSFHIFAVVSRRVRKTHGHLINIILMQAFFKFGPYFAPVARCITPFPAVVESLYVLLAASFHRAFVVLWHEHVGRVRRDLQICWYRGIRHTRHFGRHDDFSQCDISGLRPPLLSGGLSPQFRAS